MTLSRREWLQRAVAVAIPLAAQGMAAQSGGRQTPVRPADSGKVAADPLDDPAILGRASAPLGPLDNDPGVIAIERRLRCNCGCTLDVYTCRTTDFTCTYSPAMHQRVVAQVQQGRTPEQIIQWFVAQPEYGGEAVLMAPPARGFNLAGYLVPGLAVTAIGLALAAYLGRPRAGGQEPLPATGGAAPPPRPDELERLKRALDEVDS